jgi:hypothetical protein
MAWVDNEMMPFSATKRSPCSRAMNAMYRAKGAILGKELPIKVKSPVQSQIPRRLLQKGLHGKKVSMT